MSQDAKKLQDGEERKYGEDRIFLINPQRCKVITSIKWLLAGAEPKEVSDENINKGRSPTSEKESSKV